MSCSTIGEIRLTGGTSAGQGTVEICGTNGVWGSVCDDSWGTSDAQVVCRQLGYATSGIHVLVMIFQNLLNLLFIYIGATAHSSAQFGQGAGPIQIDDVGCVGSESVLFACAYRTNDNCAKTEDAGVTCPNG